MKDQGNKKLLEWLPDHPFAFTTIASDDLKYGPLREAAIVRGEDKLFPWGIGTKLERGAIVARYVPDNRTLRVEERPVDAHSDVLNKATRRVGRDEVVDFSNLRS